MKKQILSAVLILSFLTAGFLSCKKDEKVVLKVGYGGSLCEAALHLAYERGYFAEEGLEVELIKLASGAGFDAITAGQVDATFNLMAAMVQPLANGLPAKITTGLHTGCDKVLVKADSGITRPQDLRGKKVGIPSMTGSPTVYTKRVLADHGVNISAGNAEVEFILYNVTDLPLVLANGSVDAIAMNDPTATIAANEYGYVVLLDSAIDEPYKDQYCCVAYVSDRILARNRDLAVKYTRAMQRAGEYVQGHQDEAARIQLENNWVAGDLEVNAQVLKTFYYIPSVSRAYETFGIMAAELQAIGMLDKDVDVETLRRNSFVFLEGLEDAYR
ncbi:MAG: ABC transporter substrate-binding protein [Treponema sp.]|jgi:NitT/TauT family transport system substrate-binding protein|nr:ABC transporter substrate-binding protein [Treponema sp.]